MIEHDVAETLHSQKRGKLGPDSVLVCIYIYMCVCVCMLSKNMTSISILMLPTSLFDPIHVRFFRLITVELPQSMSTVEYHEVLVHLSHNVKSRKHKDYHTICSFRNYLFNVSITFLQTLSSFSSSGEGIG